MYSVQQTIKARYMNLAKTPSRPSFPPWALQYGADNTDTMEMQQTRARSNGRNVQTASTRFVSKLGRYQTAKQSPMCQVTCMGMGKPVDSSEWPELGASFSESRLLKPSSSSSPGSNASPGNLKK